MIRFARQPDLNHIALEDARLSLTYGEMYDVKLPLEKRTLLMWLASPEVDSLATASSGFRNHHVVMPANVSDHNDVLLKLIHLYHIEGVIGPEERLKQLFPELAAERVFENCALVRIPEYFGRGPELHPELSALLSTSGSTGTAKLVRLSYYNFTSNARAIAEYLNLGPDEKTLLNLPLNYSYAISVINSHLVGGGTVRLSPHSVMQREFWQEINSGITSFAGVPYTYEMLERLGFTRRTYPHLKYFTQAGGHLPPIRQKIFADYAMAHGLKFYIMYGQTEATARIAFLEPNKAQQKLGSVGAVVPGAAMYLEDAQGQEIIRPEETGEIVFMGGNVAMGYAESAADLARGDDFHGVLRTGDLAWRDSDGDYYIVGRKKRFIKLFGRRTSLTHVEDLLTEHFPKLQCVAAGKDDHLVIYAVSVSLKDANLGVHEVQAYLATRLNCVPSALEVSEVNAIPLNAAGKILYDRLPRL